MEVSARVQKLLARLLYNIDVSEPDGGLLLYGSRLIVV
jgi:hypothetical protein